MPDVMNRQECKVLLLFDDTSKKAVKTSVSVLGTYGIKFIDSLDAISDEAVAYSNKVVILEGYTTEPSFMSDLVLYKELFGLQYFFLGSAKYFNALSSVASCYECNIVSLNFELLQAAVYGDTSQAAEDSPNYFEAQPAAEQIVANSGGYPAEVVSVAKAYLANIDIYKTVSQEKVSLQEHLKILETENAKLNFENAKLLKGYRDVLIETQKLNASLERYEQIITKDVYEKIRIHDYVNRPKVVYFKEYDDFLNLDVLLETLASALRLQARKSVKVLRLFDSATSRKIPTLPGYYKVLRNQYLIADVVNNDFLCKSGDYRRVLDKLFMNEAGLNILILVDSKNYDDVVLTGAPVQINLCRDTANVARYGLDSANTIVNFSDEDDFIWQFRYDTDNMNNNEKMIYLSSRPVIRKLLDSIREIS